MIISVASGKGGTGKTTIATNLALALGKIQFIDCDVEEPNAHLFLKPRIEKKMPVTIPIPRIDEDRCTHCGRCAEACEFNALVVFPQNVLVFDELCHGCGVCSYVCPEKVITEEEKEIGVIEMGSKDGIEFIHGRLNVGEPMAAPIIRVEKSLMKKEGTVILDAPPGTSCPVIETVKGGDFCLLVAEPTPFGLNDLELTVQMLKKLNVPMGVLINRADVGNEGVKEYCHNEGIPILLEIPMDRRIAKLYSEGIPLTEELPEYRDKFIDLFAQIKQIVEGGGK
ncbi:MAG: (4Fe-4S)-binding protein [Deltaproteobacteria bacterium]|nr:MAG: (4Fe-4S)-binding protein [Deltaproteobacteria bacterium]